MKKSVFFVSLTIVLFAAFANGQTSPPLAVSLDEETLFITNPSDHSYIVDLFFFFWDGTKDKHTIKATDVSIPARGTEGIAVRRLGKEFNSERQEPRPEIIAFSLVDENDECAVCYFRRTSDRQYVMDDEKTEELSELVRTIPGYREGETRLLRK